VHLTESIGFLTLCLSGTAVSDDVRWSTRSLLAMRELQQQLLLQPRWKGHRLPSQNTWRPTSANPALPRSLRPISANPALPRNRASSSSWQTSNGRSSPFSRASSRGTSAGLSPSGKASPNLTNDEALAYSWPMHRRVRKSKSSLEETREGVVPHATVSPEASCCRAGESQAGKTESAEALGSAAAAAAAAAAATLAGTNEHVDHVCRLLVIVQPPSPDRACEAQECSRQPSPEDDLTHASPMEQEMLTGLPPRFDDNSAFSNLQGPASARTFRNITTGSPLTAEEVLASHLRDEQQHPSRLTPNDTGAAVAVWPPGSVPHSTRARTARGRTGPRRHTAAEASKQEHLPDIHDPRPHSRDDLLTEQQQQQPRPATSPRLGLQTDPRAPGRMSPGRISPGRRSPGRSSPTDANTVIAANRLLRAGLPLEEPRPPGSLRDADVKRRCRDLRSQALQHKETMGYKSLEQKEELASYRSRSHRSAISAGAKQHRDVIEQVRGLRSAMEACHGSEAAGEAHQSLERLPSYKLTAASADLNAGTKDGVFQDKSLNASSRSPADVEGDASSSGQHWNSVENSLRGLAQENRSNVHLQALAERLQLTVDDVCSAKAFFEEFIQEHQEHTSDGETSSSLMEPGDFAAAAVQLMIVQGKFQGAVQGRMERIGERVKQVKKDEGLEFEEFLAWYCMGLRDHMQLSELAARHQVNLEYVIHLKRCFEASDVDQSGYVDTTEELMHLLQRVLRVPSHLELPRSRLDMFLKELCLGSSKQVTFEDFLQWWLKYFRDESPHNKAPFEEFYCQVRRLGWNRRDPPVHHGIVPSVDSKLERKAVTHKLHHSV